MLPREKLWHNATKRAPETEARLLAFAVGTPGQPLTPEELAEAVKNGTVLPTPDQTVTNQADATKDAVRDVLEEKEVEKEEQGSVSPEAQKTLTAVQEKEAVRKRFEDIINKARNNGNKILELKKRMQNKETTEKMKKYGNAELERRWKEDIRLLNREEFNTTQEKEFAEAAAALWEGGMSPEEFLRSQGQYLKTLPYGFDTPGNLIHIIFEEVATAEGMKDQFSKEKWPTVNQSDRITVSQKLLDRMQVDRWMEGKKIQYLRLGLSLGQEEKFIEKVEKEAKRIEDEEKESTSDRSGIMGAFRTIRWYSINDYITGISKTISAVQSTWETRKERVGAEVARNISAFFIKPFNFFPIHGQEVDTMLGQQLDAKDGEEENAMKEMLEGNFYTWDKVFGAGGEFQHWTGKGRNANKARGCLTWAAEHGFLYDIDDDLDNPKKPIFGIPIEDICYDWAGDDAKINNYFTVLRGKNSSGRESEIDKGYKLEYDNADATRFVRLIEREMDNKNIWAAAGIMKRAHERGLAGHISSWMFTTILQKLRQHPDLQRQIPVAFWDLIGKGPMYTTGFTLGWSKAYRNQLKAWCMSGDDDILDKTPLKDIGVVEREILAASPSLSMDVEEDRQQVNDMVAKFLSSEIIALPNGQKMHIFESRFSEYRKAVKSTFASMPAPHKEDTDFAMGRTEKTMLPVEVFDAILSYTSTREFDNKDWVQPFLGSLLSLARDLKEAGTSNMNEAHTNYCDEISERMDTHFQALLNESLADKQLLAIDPTTGLPAIASLVSEGLLHWSAVRSALWAKKLADQLENTFPDFYAKHIAPDIRANPLKDAANKGKEKNAAKTTQAA